jgi:hypothetical protein
MLGDVIQALESYPAPSYRCHFGQNAPPPSLRAKDEGQSSSNSGNWPLLHG